MKIKRFEKLAAPVLSIIIALLIGTAIIKICGYHPLSAYSALLKGAFGSFRYTMATLEKSVPLILCGHCGHGGNEKRDLQYRRRGSAFYGGHWIYGCRTVS